MEQVYIVYKSDTWHSYNSRNIIGICTEKLFAILICEKQAKKEGQKLSSTDKFDLSNMMQTQNYTGEGEFQIEKVQLNVLL